MNNTNSSQVDLTFYLNTQLGTAICLAILSPVTIISNVLLLLSLYKDALKCLPYSCYLLHRRFSPGGFHNWCVNRTFLYNEQFLAIFLMVFGASWTVQKFILLWSFVLVRGPQLVVPACSWSNLVAVRGSNLPSPLPINRDHTQGPRVYSRVVRVLHRVHLLTIRRSSVTIFGSSGSASSLNSHYSVAHVGFVYAIVVVS